MKMSNGKLARQCREPPTVEGALTGEEGKGGEGSAKKKKTTQTHLDLRRMGRSHISFKDFTNPEQ